MTANVDTQNEGLQFLKMPVDCLYSADEDDEWQDVADWYVIARPDTAVSPESGDDL